jgi:hypothetical protein
VFAHGTAAFAHGTAAFAHGTAAFAHGTAAFAHGTAAFAHGTAAFAHVRMLPHMKWTRPRTLESMSKQSPARRSPHPLASPPAV